jgi:hypothetical protein
MKATRRSLSQGMRLGLYGEDYATGQYTKEQLLKRARNWGFTNRRGKPLTSQAIGMLLGTSCTPAS